MLKSLAKTNRLAISQLIDHLRNPLYLNGYALSASTILSGALGVVFWIVAAHLYQPADIGLNSAVISTMSFLAGISLFNLNNVLPRFIPRAGKFTGRMIVISYLVASVTALVVAGLFVLASRAWNIDQGSLGTGNLFALWFVLSVALWCIFILEDGVLAGLRRAIWVPVENTSFSILKLALLVVFATSFPQHGIYVAWTLPMLIFVVIVNAGIFGRFIPRHLANAQTQPASDAFQGMARYVIGDYIGSLFSFATQMLPPLMVLNRLGAQENAYFYIGWILGIAMETLPWNMVMSLTVEASANQEKLNSYARQTLINMARLLIPMVIFVLIAAPYLLATFGHVYASESTMLLRLMALSVIPTALIAVYTSVAHVQGKVIIFTAIPTITCILTLSIGYVLLQSIGIVGVGIAALATNTAIAIVLWIVGFKARPQPE